jgi:hypothetical protein
MMKSIRKRWTGHVARMHIGSGGKARRKETTRASFCMISRSLFTTVESFDWQYIRPVVKGQDVGRRIIIK